MLTRAVHILLIAVAVIGFSCTRKQDLKKIVIWHQMRVDERLVLEGQMKRYMDAHPGITVEAIYKETEELRSGYIVAAIAGQGPDLVYGPSDQVGPFHVMSIIRPLEGILDSAYLSKFNPKALTHFKGHLYQIADKLGNHLTLVYNKKLVSHPPDTDTELIDMCQKIMAEKNGDGPRNVYGIVWNYTEPFFYIPWMSGFGGWVMDADNRPTLDTQSNIDGLQFIKDLRDKYKIVPKDADYNVADALFKDGKAAFIVNGDWSWSSYVKAGMDIGITPMPVIAKTGLRCSPMVSPKGYSVNNNVTDEKLPLVIDFLKFMMEPANQLETAKIINTMPTRVELYADPFITSNEILKNSQRQIDFGRAMPVVPEIRAIWDAMRPNYQAVLGGVKSAKDAAHDMQALALKKIAEMNE